MTPFLRHNAGCDFTHYTFLVFSEHNTELSQAICPSWVMTDKTQRVPLQTRSIATSPTVTEVLSIARSDNLPVASVGEFAPHRSHLLENFDLARRAGGFHQCLALLGVL